MGVLRDYFEANQGRIIHKWMHYFEIYERHFERFRGREVHLLEIGVSFGGSLQMWKDYFGPQAHIYGVDVLPECQRLEEDRVKIFIGDQGNRDFLRHLRASIPKIDILIDDGGHRPDQQIPTFEELYPTVAPDGVYLCEDLHTNYFEKFGGALRRPDTFIEYSKRLIDQLNAWYSEDPANFQVDAFTRSAHSMHFYDSVIVIEKRLMSPPEHRRTGRVAPGA